MLHTAFLFQINYFKPKYNKIISNAGTTNFKPISNSFAKNLFFIRVTPLSFNAQPAIKQRNSAFNGINMFEVIKSRKSKSVLPNIFNPLNIQNDNVVGIAIAEIIKNKIVQALLRDIPNLSTIVAQGPSTILIPDVTAAQKSSTKNATEMKSPNGI